MNTNKQNSSNGNYIYRIIRYGNNSSGSNEKFYEGQPIKYNTIEMTGVEK